MKGNILVLKYSIFAFMLFFAYSSCKQKKGSDAQDSSGISINQYDSQTIENLAVLCKVWGFLKYYHPEVADGKHDWDAELFKVIPSVIQTKSVDDRSKVLKNWIKDLGEVKARKTELPSMSEEIKMYPDLDWTEDASALGKDVTELLSVIKNAERKDSCHYVGFVANAGNPVFKNEKAYENMDYSDANFRLLALFRYWNIIQYYFPYKYLIDDNWHDVLMEFIPQFIDAKSELNYKLALLKLITKVDDTHAGFYDEKIEAFKGMRTAPYEITFVEGKAVVTNLHRPINLNENIQVGDILLSINNIPVESLVKEKSGYTPSSNYPVLLRDIASDLLRTNDNKLFITYEHNFFKFSDSISCPYISGLQKESMMQKKKPLVETLDNITYLYMGSTIGGTVPSKIETKGLIIDLRCYPDYNKVKGYWDYSYLYPDSTAFVKFTKASTVSPGKFTFSKDQKVGKPNPNYYKGKKVILINEQSQSHAEFMAMKYRCAPNTIVIGSTTAGADGNVSFFYFPGGVRTCITALGVYYPDGKETQRIGIVPDIEVKPTIRGIKEGRDEVLEKAIELINS